MTLSLQDLSNIEEELHSFALQNTRLTKIRMIRQLYDQIESAIESGVSIALLCDFLKQKGIDINPPYLYSTLHKIRKERRINSSKINKQLQNQVTKNIDVIQKEKQNTNNETKTKKLDRDNLPVSAKTHTLEECINYVNTLKGQDKIDNLLCIERTFSSFQDRYQLYGGDPEKLEGKHISSQRSMISTIKMRIFGDIQRAEQLDRYR